MFEIDWYKTASGRCPVKEFLEDLSRDKNKEKEIAKVYLYLKRLGESGMAINNEFPQTIRFLEKDIYELRPDKNRIFFFYFRDNRIVLLHAYRKHGAKCPPQQIKKAIKEKNDYIMKGSS